jgi:UDP-2,3-diacylglucosamine pyrophosphatase LpxH
LLIVLSSTVYGQKNSPFKSDVEEPLKPWTNLEFYNDPANFQFALVSDNTGGSRIGIFDDAVEKLNMMMPEFVLSIGDLIQGYTENREQIEKEWDEFNQKVEKLNMPFFYLPGNHDITNTVMQEEWETRFGRRYYNFIYKDVLFIILDSNDDDDFNLTEDQTAYALKIIEENRDVKWTFVLVHHPIWKYNTGGRFEKIEEALSDRKHTVIAGHQHRYQYIERNKSNYYVLGTTGGSSRLRGNRFGEFDHIVWMTMTDNGPVMANLRLDGILSHDITNESTAIMAQSMLRNASFKNIILTNPDEKFENATVYFQFTNTSEVPLNIDLSFLHHHQVKIIPAKKNIKIMPGEERIVEISIETEQAVTYKDLDFLQYYWKLSYEGDEYKDFYLDGKSDFSIIASSPDYFKPKTPQFVQEINVTFDQPFNLLKPLLKINDQSTDSGSLPNTIQISENSKIELVLTNEKGQSTSPSTKSYEKISFLKGKKIKNTIAGLSYTYFEGNWDGIPDFTKQTPIKNGIANDFLVGDIALNKNNFGIKYTGYIEILEDGMYYFRCRADDAGSLKIHDKLVCLDGTSAIFDNSDRKVGPTGAIALKKGMHPVEINFYENQGGERLRFYYKKSEEAEWHFMELNDFFRTK